MFRGMLGVLTNGGAGGGCGGDVERGEPCTGRVVRSAQNTGGVGGEADDPGGDDHEATTQMLYANGFPVRHWWVGHPDSDLGSPYRRRASTGAALGYSQTAQPWWKPLA